MKIGAIAAAALTVAVPGAAAAQPAADPRQLDAFGRPADRISVVTDRTVDPAEGSRPLASKAAERRANMLSRQARASERKSAKRATPVRTARTVGVWADAVAQIKADPATPD